MLQKLKSIRRPGLRNIKTCITIVIIFVLYRLINRESVLLALVAGILCMQDSVDKSIRLGIDRVKGTILGGLFGVVFAVLEVQNLEFTLFLVCMFFGVMAFIYICNLINSRSSIVIGCIVFLAVIIDSNVESPVGNAVTRTLDTIVGIIIAFIINQLIFRPKPEHSRGLNSVNPFFNYEIHRVENQKVMGWSNEVTTELYIFPEDSICEDRRFNFRLSHTEIKIENSSFTKYPGYKRHVILLDGEMQLSHCFHGEVQHYVKLGQYEVDRFKGEWDSSCQGICSDLCLTTDSNYAGYMAPIYAPDIFELKNDRFEGFYILADGTKITFNCEGKEAHEILNKGDFAMVGWYKNGSHSYSVTFPESSNETEGDAVAIRINCWEEKSTD